MGGFKQGGSSQRSMPLPTGDGRLPGFPYPMDVVTNLSFLCPPPRPLMKCVGLRILLRGVNSVSPFKCNTDPLCRHLRQLQEKYYDSV